MHEASTLSLNCIHIHSHKVFFGGRDVMVWHTQIIDNEPLRYKDLVRCSTMRKHLMIAVE